MILKSSDQGSIIKTIPINPEITAKDLYHPNFSPNKGIANNVTIIGPVYSIVATRAKGKYK